MGGRDIQKAQLVRFLTVVGLGNFDGITRVAEVDEGDTFDDPSILDVETWNDALGEQTRFPPLLSRLLSHLEFQLAIVERFSDDHALDARPHRFDGLDIFYPGDPP